MKQFAISFTVTILVILALLGVGAIILSLTTPAVASSVPNQQTNAGSFCVVPTNTPKPPTNTPIPSTSTPKPPTNTPVPPTNTLVPPTNTPVPPTNTLVPPTNTPIPPTATLVPPTDTPYLTNTPVPTDTSIPKYTPTKTKKKNPPQPTNTPTFVYPTWTPIVPLATPTLEPTPSITPVCDCCEQQLPYLDRIATALEKIANILDRALPAK